MTRTAWRHRGAACVPVDGTRRTIRGVIHTDIRYTNDPPLSFAGPWPYTTVAESELERVPTRMPRDWKLTGYRQRLHGLLAEVEQHERGFWAGCLSIRWNVQTGVTCAALAAAAAAGEHEGSFYLSLYSGPDGTTSPGHASYYISDGGRGRGAPEIALELEHAAARLAAWQAALAFVRAAPLLLAPSRCREARAPRECEPPRSKARAGRPRRHKRDVGNTVA